MRLERVDSPTKNNPPRKSLSANWLVWFLSGLALFLLLAKFLFSLNIIWNIFNYAFQVDESEGMIVAETMLMDQGVDIYAPLTNQRFIAAPYTSLYYLLNWPALHFTGPSFKPGRLISFLAFLGIALLLYKLVRVYSYQLSVLSYKSSSKRQSPSSFTPFMGVHPSSFTALIWLSLGLAAFWSGAVKPDVLALFFGLFGVYAVYRYATRSSGLSDPVVKQRDKLWLHLRQERWLYGAALLFALAAHTKQTAFAGVLAGLVFLVFFRPGAAFRLGALWALLAFGPMVLMNWLSRGGWWYHIVTVHELPWSIENYTKFFGGFVQSYQLYVLLATFFLIRWAIEILKDTLVRRNPFSALRANSATLFALYLGTSWGAGLSAGTYGGNHNHLLEFAAAVCLCSGVVLVRLAQWWQAAGKLKWLYPLVLGLICLQTLGLFVGEGRIKPQNFPVLGSSGPTQTGLDLLRERFFNEQWLGLEYRVPPAGLKDGMGQVAAFMTNDVGPYIYTDNVSLAIASKKPIITTDPFTQTHATYFGRWDESRLIELIRQKQFHLIVLRARIEDRLQTTGEARDIYLSPGLAHAILENYKLTQANAAFIYEPK